MRPLIWFGTFGSTSDSLAHWQSQFAVKILQYFRLEAAQKTVPKVPKADERSHSIFSAIRKLGVFFNVAVQQEALKCRLMAWGSRGDAFFVPTVTNETFSFFDAYCNTEFEF